MPIVSNAAAVPDAAMSVQSLSAWYGSRQAVRDVSVDIRARAITAIIGPSGSGKSTLLRCLDRMHEVVPGARSSGKVLYQGVDIYGPTVEPAAVRRTIGMVFQQPNPFPTMTIYDNVAAPARFNGVVKGRAAEDELVERCLDSRRPVERGQGQAAPRRHVAVGRAAAAPVHRARPRARAQGAPDGRTVLGPGPRRDAPGRGADVAPEGGLHDRDRDPQHAAGVAGQRHHRVLHDGRGPSRLPGRGRARPARSSPARGSN